MKGAGAPILIRHFFFLFFVGWGGGEALTTEKVDMFASSRGRWCGSPSEEKKERSFTIFEKNRDGLKGQGLYAGWISPRF